MKYTRPDETLPNPTMSYDEPSGVLTFRADKHVEMYNIHLLTNDDKVIGGLLVESDKLGSYNEGENIDPNFNIYWANDAHTEFCVNMSEYLKKVPEGKGYYFESRSTSTDPLKWASSEWATLKATDDPVQPVYRLYNPNSGEHLYTTDAHETRVLATSGWAYEGIAWFAPQTGAAVYRLYSPVTTVHLYTSDQNEVNVLLAGGAWQMDNEGKPMFYTGDADTPGQLPIYRLYNEQERMHLLTTDRNEYDTLGEIGWNREGEKLFCLSIGDSTAALP